MRPEAELEDRKEAYPNPFIEKSSTLGILQGRDFFLMYVVHTNDVYSN